MRCHGLELQLPADLARSGVLVGGPKALKRRELLGQISAEFGSRVLRSAQGGLGTESF